MALKPEYLPLIKVLEKRLFAIPDYQRAYSWKTQQRKELFQDIEKVLYASDSNRHHFMATIVCLQTNQTEEIGTDELERVDIVDGQQSQRLQNNPVEFLRGESSARCHLL